MSALDVKSSILSTIILELSCAYLFVKSNKYAYSDKLISSILTSLSKFANFVFVSSDIE